jgi:hypothetical protein
MLVSTTLYEVRIYVLPSYQSQSPQRLPRVPTHPHQHARLGKKEEGGRLGPGATLVLEERAIDGRLRLDNDGEGFKA